MSSWCSRASTLFRDTKKRCVEYHYSGMKCQVTTGHQPIVTHRDPKPSLVYSHRQFRFHRHARKASKSGGHNRRAYIPWKHMQPHRDLPCLCTSLPVEITRLNSLTSVLCPPGNPAPKLGKQGTEGGQLPPEVPLPCSLPMAPHPTAHYHFPTEAKGSSGITPGVSQGSHQNQWKLLSFCSYTKTAGAVCAAGPWPAVPSPGLMRTMPVHAPCSLEICFWLASSPARTGHSTKVHGHMDTKLTT